MYMIVEVSQYVAVASFSEAWIEIGDPKQEVQNLLSPPSRRRGLKFVALRMFAIRQEVASFSEAWIEILSYLRLFPW